MFAIFNPIKNYYFNDRGDMIVFSTEQEAMAFIQAFMEYALAAVVQENPLGAIEVMQMCSACQVEIVDTSHIKWILWTECSNSKRKERTHD